MDDLIVYRINAEYYLLVVNAANADKDFEWIKHHSASYDAEAENVSSGYALLAFQGPHAETILQDLTDRMLDHIPYYWSQQLMVDGVSVRVSRTGYTGEDGFEIFCDPSDSVRLWNRLLVIGRARGATPCGLAARNTLRLEAGYRLCGNDMDETITPLEAGLGWVVKLNKGDFIGRDSLRRQKEEGLKRKLVGFEVLDKAPARDGYPVVVDGQEVGKVTSGSPAPFLKKNIGFALMPVEYSAIGTEFSVVVRSRHVPARVAATPFYKRERRFD
jgi:aminomethyltransferase